MKEWMILLLVVGVKAVFDIPVSSTTPACVVSNSSVSVPWGLPQVSVRVWVPPRNTSEYIIKLKIFFVKYARNITYSVIRLKDDMAETTDWDQSSLSTGGNPVHFKETDFGTWLNVTFEVSESYTMKRTDSQEILVDDYLGALKHVEEVIIFGSNITINCDGDQLIWRVFDTKVVVPLAPSGRGGWMFGIYSSKGRIRPIITLGGFSFPLCWSIDNSSLVTEIRWDLEQYIQYQFVVECLPPSVSSSVTNVTCYIKNDTTVIKELNLTSMPTFLEVENEKKKPDEVSIREYPLEFFFIHKNPTLLNATDSDGDEDVRTGWSSAWPAMTGILMCLLILIIIGFFASHYDRQRFDNLLRPILPDGFVRYS